MPSNTGLRTIWVTLRAVNYTTQVFIDTIKMVSNLQKSEDKLAISTLRMGTHAMSAGMMFMTLGQGMDNTISKVITENELFKQLSDTLTPYIATIFTIIGAIQFLIGVQKIYEGLQEADMIIKMKQIAVNHALAFSWTAVAIAMSAAVMAFVIFYQIGQQMGGIITTIIGLTMAILGLAIAIMIWKGAITFGTSTMADLAMIGSLTAVGAGAGLALGSIQSGHAMGTRMVEATGPALVHRGEVIYNPATHRPTQIGNDLEGMGAPTTIYQMPMTIKEMNTKADVDNVDETIRQSWRRITRNNRR